eukprot:g12863.t1
MTLTAADHDEDEAVRTPRIDVAGNLRLVRERIENAAAERGSSRGAGGERDGGEGQKVRLVAVSKTKPTSLIKAAYAAGQRCFGENYAQELVEKMQELADFGIHNRSSSTNSEEQQDEGPIIWHFIGHLQSNKAGAIVKAAKVIDGDGESAGALNLVVETVDSEKLAKVLNKEVEKAFPSSDSTSVDEAVISGGAGGDVHVARVGGRPPAPATSTAPRAPHQRPRLDIFLQLNSSGEESKSGITISSAKEDDSNSNLEPLLALARRIQEDCPRLRLRGLMTIGAPDYSGCRTEDFELLHRCKRALMEENEKAAAANASPVKSLELSMGMSNDFETAIKQGSTSVRIGSTIFGARKVAGTRTT